ncbi:glycosyltransferase [Lujinxingia vulgaris]|nr:glycosyltransferase [Lujinxingia vulgaris]
MGENSRHIALFMPSLGGGGAERVMLTLAGAFARGGDRVDLIVAQGGGAYRNTIPAGVRLIDLQVGRVLRAFVPLTRYLRRERPDGLLSTLAHANVVAALARDAARVDTSVVVREASTVSHSVGLGPKGRLIRGAMRVGYRRADGVIAVSQGVGQALVEAGIVPSSAIATIYSPLDIDAIEEAAKSAPEHPWLKGEPGQRDTPLLLAVGRLTEAKDYPNLLHAMALLINARPARLLILGEGGKRAELEALIKQLGLDEVVQMPGFVDNPYAYMARADLYVMSSRWEGLPTAPVQALAVGAKMVLTDCPSGPREILEGGRWGRLVPVNDAEALARALSEALDDEDAPDVRPRARAFDHLAIAKQYRRVMFGA